MERCAVIALAATGLAAQGPRAQGAWPERPERNIVPVPPGGSVDIIASLFQARLSEGFGKPIVIDDMTMRAGRGRAVSAPDVKAEIEKQGRAIRDKRITADS